MDPVDYGTQSPPPAGESPAERSPLGRRRNRHRDDPSGDARAQEGRYDPRPVEGYDTGSAGYGTGGYAPPGTGAGPTPGYPGGAQGYGTGGYPSGAQQDTGGYPATGQGTGGYPAGGRDTGGYPAAGQGTGGYPAGGQGTGPYGRRGYAGDGYPASRPGGPGDDMGGYGDRGLPAGSSGAGRGGRDPQGGSSGELPPGVYDLRGVEDTGSPDNYGVVPRDVRSGEGEPYGRDGYGGRGGGAATGPQPYGGQAGSPGRPGTGPLPIGPGTAGPNAGGTGPQTGGLGLGPHTGGLGLGPNTGGIRMGGTGPIRTGPIPGERLQADRLHRDPLLGDSSTYPSRNAATPASDALELGSFPDPGGPPAVSGQRSTRHRPRGGQAEKSSRDRVLVLYVMIVLIVVVGLGAGGTWLILGPLHGSSQQPAASTVVPRQQTLLIGLTDGNALTSALLLGAGPGYAEAVLVPATLLVDGGNGKQVTLAAAGGGARGAGQSLARAFGVTIDQTWVLTSQGMAALVDATGGVVVDVDQEIRAGNVLVAAGKGQRLTGAQAGAYVSVRLPGEDAQGPLARFAAVLGQVLSGLPSQGPAASQQLAQLGGGSMTTGSRDQLAAQLVAIGQQLGTTGLPTTPLPVTPAGTTQYPDAVAADKAAVAKLIQDRMNGIGPSATS